MYFGENVREVISISCGEDLRAVPSRTVLPGIESPEVQRRLATNLEHAFDIALSPEDISHLTTVRAVLQCVRLRHWERALATKAQTTAAAIATSAPTRTMRERFVRYTPPPSPLHGPPAAPSTAIHKR